MVPLETFGSSHSTVFRFGLGDDWSGNIYSYYGTMALRFRLRCILSNVRVDNRVLAYVGYSSKTKPKYLEQK